MAVIARQVKGVNKAWEWREEEWLMTSRDFNKYIAGRKP